MPTYQWRHYAYRAPRELRDGGGRRWPVLIAGAGPVGLTAAIDLAQRGIASVVLDDNNVVAVGSRAICWAKRTLEIFDRLGVGERMLAKGVTWNVGRVYHRDRELYQFNLLPEGGHKMPAFINLQQYYVEQFLVERALEFPDLIELRWKSRVCGVDNSDAGVAITVETPDGTYRLLGEWLIAADGARSTVRSYLGHGFEGQTFEEKFLIVDVRMDTDYPSDRRFWFQPTFDPAESVLIHRQPDNVFRIDFQLGWDADTEVERQPHRAMERVRRVVGTQIPCELEWCSVYTFRCARMPRFVDRRVLFAGDAAHVVSPFGARGGNGGIQDVDNLCWKLAYVLCGKAPQSLLQGYDRERQRAADENIQNSSRTSAFMSPKTKAEREFRDGALALAREHSFARALVNSGRLSKPCSLAGMPGFAPDETMIRGLAVPGTPCSDAPVLDAAGNPRWLLGYLTGVPAALVFVDDPRAMAHIEAGIDRLEIPDVRVLAIVASGWNGALTARGLSVLIDAEGWVRERYAGSPDVTYLARPDQHVMGRWSRWDPGALRSAWQASLGRDAP